MKAKAATYWKASPISRPPFFLSSRMPCENEMLCQPAASCLINILPKGFPLPITKEILIGDMFNWYSTVSFCFCCSYPILFLCCYLQGGCGIHGAALQAPALRWQEAGVWWQEEHLHSASTPYREWEGRCLTWFWINQIHHNIPFYSTLLLSCAY